MLLFVVAIAVEASSNLLTFTDAVTANAVDFVFVVVASDGALSLSLSLDSQAGQASVIVLENTITAHISRRNIHSFMLRRRGGGRRRKDMRR